MHAGQHLLLGLSGPSISAVERDLLADVQPAGTILFTRNLVDARQTRALTDALRDLLGEDTIIAIDQEGGRVTRTKDFAPVLPAASQLRDGGDFYKSAHHGNFIGEQLALLGINLNFAPVLDIARDDGVFAALPGRCWGRAAQQTIDHAGQFNRWMRKHKVLSCAKHFPSCSRADTDPHHELPISSVSWDEMMEDDILPYTALMPELDSIMSAHVHFSHIDSDQPGLPASLSKRILTDYLRNRLGFDQHLVFTDDMDMGAITRAYPRGADVKLAIEAGNDVALICHDLASVPKAIKALETLDVGYRIDTEERLKRFRKKMKFPPAFTEKRWNDLCEKMESFAADYDSPEEIASSSPVEDY